MGSGDLSADLTIGILMPSSSVRPEDAHWSNPDAQGSPRRRSRLQRKHADQENGFEDQENGFEREQDESIGDDNPASSAGDDTAAHQLDQLA